MKKLLFLSLLTFLLLNGMALAVTQVNFFVNGMPVSTITQGDTLVWQADCTPGGTVTFEIWMDLDSSQTLDSNDVKLFTYNVTDGDSSGNGGPPDLDGLNGFITNSIGPFGFAPIHWGFVAKEGNTSAEGYLTILPMPNPPGTVSGTVSFDDGHNPANILVTTDLEHPPFWNAVTDSNGNYTINIGETGDYLILPWYSNTYYVAPEPQTVTVNGAVTGVDFLFLSPQCTISGGLLDESGNPLLRNIRIGVEDVNTFNDVARGEFSDGQYLFGLFPGTYRLNFDDESLNPDYLAPVTWNNPYFTFTLDSGMAMTKDITFYSPDTFIYAKVLMNGVPASTPNMFEVQAWNDTVGRMVAMNDTTGMVTLPVKSGYIYMAEIDVESFPPGYGVIGGPHRDDVQPGDTVWFKLVNYTDQIYGSVNLDAGDPPPVWEDMFMVWVESGGIMVNSTHLNPDGTFSVYVPNDTLRVGVWNTPDYVVKPQYIEPVLPNDTLTFMANYANAQIVGHLFGLDTLPQEDGVFAQSDGDWPDVYTSWSPVYPDSSYSLRVCEGTWTIFPPNVQGYIIPPATTINIPEVDTVITIDFYYTPDVVEKKLDHLLLSYQLKQNYPNPFNPVTTIPFSVPRTEHVVIEIFDVLGSHVETLLDKTVSAGNYEVHWNAANHPSGIYFCKMKAGDFTAMRKLILMK